MHPPTRATEDGECRRKSEKGWVQVCEEEVLQTVTEERSSKDPLRPLSGLTIAVKRFIGLWSNRLRLKSGHNSGKFTHVPTLYRVVDGWGTDVSQPTE